jgi:hypothetical protein
MPPIAALSPGQGSQVPDMRGLVACVWRMCEAVPGFVDDGPYPQRVDEPTRPAQPAMLCASPAGWARVTDPIAAPVASAGHGPGALTALAAARDERLVAHVA